MVTSVQTVSVRYVDLPGNEERARRKLATELQIRGILRRSSEKMGKQRGRDLIDARDDAFMDIPDCQRKGRAG
jgi:hypothetical protein